MLLANFQKKKIRPVSFEKKYSILCSFTKQKSFGILSCSCWLMVFVVQKSPEKIQNLFDYHHGGVFYVTSCLISSLCSIYFQPKESFRDFFNPKKKRKSFPGLFSRFSVPFCSVICLSASCSCCLPCDDSIL